MPLIAVPESFIQDWNPFHAERMPNGDVTTWEFSHGGHHLTIIATTHYIQPKFTRVVIDSFITVTSESGVVKVANDERCFNHRSFDSYYGGSKLTMEMARTMNEQSR